MSVLRPLTLADLDELLVVQREGAVEALGHIFPQDQNPFPTERIRERWLAELADPAVDCFAVVLHRRIAGFAATRGEEFLHLGTARDTWGSGLAEQVHDAVLDHLRAGGHTHARLRVLVENARAIRFYTRLGWRPTGVTERTDFAPHPLLRVYERDLA
ncbi:GNAT family protein [Propioniciclava sp.]|uniref:GNAT family N-acetyltransferase n=1 Tax=Propioniciclava sp. TaxID=2038686 RepID=UPI00260919A0|nr:GNAT family protein [Propioniciclava sp.]